MAGHAFVDGQRADKAGVQYSVEAEVTVSGGRRRFVSRGGLKLEAALEAFGVAVEGRSAIDVGSSTGGFTDCLLQRGASRVFCVDVGYGQLAEKLRTDPRVTVKDRFNARALSPPDLPFACTLAVVDVSFISLRLILPPLALCLEKGAEIVALVKPQFEAGKDAIGKGGIVKDPALREGAVEGITAFASEIGLKVMGRINSPITGADGNVEYLIHVVTPGPATPL
jgi:23S rRNA (cytidine1920-2'-O)/16S rRNA (cytidine1409-2'-O)-methyltransferase